MSRRLGVCALNSCSTTLLRFLCLAILCTLGAPFAAGQVKLVKVTEQIEVPQDTPQLLLRLSCKVAAEQFHVTGETEFPLTLVIGEENEEHYTADDSNREYTVYLKRWNESRFTTATMMIAVRRLALPMQKKMITEVLQRAHAIAPIRVEQLSGEKAARGE